MSVRSRNLHSGLGGRRTDGCRYYLPLPGGAAANRVPWPLEMRDFNEPESAIEGDIHRTATVDGLPGAPAGWALHRHRRATQPKQTSSRDRFPLPATAVAKRISSDTPL